MLAIVALYRPPSSPPKPTTAQARGARFAALLLCFVGLAGGAAPAGAQNGSAGAPPQISDDTSGNPIGDAAQVRTPDSLEPPEGDVVWSFDSPIGPFEYRAARGLRVGDTGLNIGGFTTFEIEKEEGEPGIAALEGINFLVLFDPIERVRAFMELEIGDLFEVDMSDGAVESDPTANFQRLYGEVRVYDWLNLRAGKFQTPVGRWNLAPAEPFVWTATEPIVVQTAFDEQQTGGMVFGSFFPGDHVLGYRLYGQFTDPFDVEEDEEPADRTAGARLEYGNTLAPWSLGTSFLASERDGRWSYLGGLDGVWAKGPLELTGVFTYERGDLEERDLWDFHLQGVLHAYRGVYLVARYEHFDPAGPEPASNIGDVGIAWLPKPYINFKAGYRFADRESEHVTRGFKLALAFLF